MTLSTIDELPRSIPVSIQPTPESPHHVVESFHIQGGKHLKDVQLGFADGLNVIIGGRGSGKTTVMQNLRHSVGAAATGPRAARNEQLVEGTLAGGRLTTRVRTKHGVHYVASRTAIDPTRVTDVDGTPQALSLDSELFRVEVYSQREIESMAENPAAQLALIDKFAEVEIRDHHDAIARVERQLTLNGAALVRLEADVGELITRTRDLPSVTAALAALAGAAGPNADEVRRAQDSRLTRGRETSLVKNALDEVRAVRARIDALDVEVKRRLRPEALPGVEPSPNRALLERVAVNLNAALSALTSALEQARVTLAGSDAGSASTADALALVHAAQAAKDEELTRAHDADLGRIAERDRLQRRFLELEQFEKRLAERRREHDALSAQRQEMRLERDHLISARVAVRSRVAQELTDALEERIRVRVTRTADHGAYVALLCELLKGSHLRTELIRDIAENIRPEDLVALVLKDDPTKLQALDDAKSGKADRAHRFLSTLRASGRLFELDTVAVADVPLLELKIEKRFQPSHEASAGQACTVILSILLLQSCTPLLIDEPEHCLDNSFIYNVLIPTLLQIKKGRQLIFVSHNPNIPVLAEAERVFVMEEKGGVGQVLEWGTVDEVRGSVERLLEGGREAFLRRSERYGHKLQAPASERGE